MVTWRRAFATARRAVARTQRTAEGRRTCGLRKVTTRPDDHWIWKGPTELPNLVLVCPLHHKYLHEYHWRIVLEDDGMKTWIPPGRSPPGVVWLATAA